VELEDMFVVQPATSPWFGYEWEDEGKPLPDGFRYASNTNEDWLTAEQIEAIIAPIEAEYAKGTLV